MSTNMTTTRVVAGEVRAEMLRANVTEQQLAEQIGMSPRSLGERLAGKRPFPVGDLEVIAAVFCVDPLSLLTPRGQA